MAHNIHGTIYVLLPCELREPLAASLSQYQVDLTAEGWRSEVHPISPAGSPASIRALLRRGFEAEGLAGALLVGAVPALLFNKDGEGSDYWHDHPCDGYYMDLYGTFSEPNSRGALTRWQPDATVGGGVQIWVSRLRADTLAGAGLGTEVELYRRYFARNHAYRTGELDLPPRRACVIWHTIDPLRSDWGTRVEELYSPENVTVKGTMCEAPEAREFARHYREALRDAHGYECIALNTVTIETVHRFGDEEITWRELRDLAPKRVLWYHMLTSEPGRHDMDNYLAGIYLFGDTPTVAIFAGTQHSGGPGKEIYPALLEGRTFGEAWQDAIRYFVEHHGEPARNYVAWTEDGIEEWRYRVERRAPGVLIGDGTLGLPARYAGKDRQPVIKSGGNGRAT